MFPNVRLLIGAVLASIVALSCGFGVFAAFRVNHDPVGRLPGVAGPLQFMADTNAATTVTAAPRPAFDSETRLGEAQVGSAAADAPALGSDRSDGNDPPSLPALEAKAEPTTDARPQYAIGTEAAPLAAASASAPAAAQETPISDAGKDATTGATADSALAQEPAEETQAAHAAREAEQGEAAGKSGEPASAAIPDVAAIEPAEDQAQPVEQRSSEQTTDAAKSARPAETKGSEKEIGKTAAMASRKTVGDAAKRPLVAAKTHRARRAPAPAVAQFGGPNSKLEHPIFQTAPAFQLQPLDSKSTGDPSSNSASGFQPPL